MKTKFTRGPAEVTDLSGALQKRSHIQNQAGDFIASTTASRFAEGDARLIVAAVNAATEVEKMQYPGIATVQALPELLYALVLCRATLSCRGGVLDNQQERRHALTVARSALAAARGEQ